MKKIEILGMGCTKCQKLAQTAEEAAKALGIPYEIEKVTEMKRIMGYGVMITPALVVDGVVKVSGRIPAPAELRKMLS
jgi:small redox-active disulfide protein 2